MTKDILPRRELILFDIDDITCEGYFVAVQPQGYYNTLIFSPYFIKRLVTFAIKKGILKDINDKSNKKGQNETQGSSSAS